MVQPDNSKKWIIPCCFVLLKNLVDSKLSSQNSIRLPPQKGNHEYPVLILRQKTGAISILFLLLVPLLIFIFLNIASIFVLIEEDARSKKICRQNLLLGQQKSARELAKLMRLNFQASHLIQEKGKILLKMSSQPHLSPFLSIELARVIDLQKSLNIKQKEILKKAEWHIHQSLEKSQLQILTKRRKNFNFLFFKNTNMNLLKPRKIGATPVSIDTTAPVYKLSENITSDQFGALLWTRKAFFPLLFNQNSHIQLGCGASLINTGLLPDAILKGVKLQSNSYLY